MSKTSPADLYVTLAESSLISKVRAGENGGKVLHHDHVVRALHGPFRTTTGESSFELPKGVVLANTRIIAWLEDRESGALLQSVHGPLANCTALANE